MKEGGQSTHKQREQVKIPLLPNKVGKRSGTMVTTLHVQILTFEKITIHIMLQFLAPPKGEVGVCKNAFIGLQTSKCLSG